jgi:hypothetical protein
MIKQSLTLLALVLSIKEGGGTYCSRIEDHDQRMLCRAETTGSSSWCSFIKRGDLRARCYAITKR